MQRSHFHTNFFRLSNGAHACFPCMVQVAMRTFPTDSTVSEAPGSYLQAGKGSSLPVCLIALDVQMALKPAFPCIVQVARRTYPLTQLSQRPPWLIPVRQTKAALPVCQIALNVQMALMLAFLTGQPLGMEARPVPLTSWS